VSSVAVTGVVVAFVVLVRHATESALLVGLL
jgi:hypothetical protein